jgi:hypothetical protein
MNELTLTLIFVTVALFIAAPFLHVHVFHRDEKSPLDDPSLDKPRDDDDNGWAHPHKGW